MFFSGWEPVIKVLILGPLGYASLVFLLRASGKRTLSKMNAFDFVITITLGSVFASLLLSQTASLAAGVSAFAVLVALQFVVTFLSVRSEAFQHLVKAQPALLYYHGRFLRDAMRQERVTEEEVRAAVRLQGNASFERVRAVVLETDSSFSVVTADAGEELLSLSNVQGFEP